MSDDIKFKFSENFGSRLTQFGYILISGGQNGFEDSSGGDGGSTLQNNYNDNFIIENTNYTITPGKSNINSTFYVSNNIESQAGFGSNRVISNNFSENIFSTVSIDGGKGGQAYSNCNSFNGENGGPWPFNFKYKDNIVIAVAQFGGGGASGYVEKNNCNSVFGGKGGDAGKGGVGSNGT